MPTPSIEKTFSMIIEPAIICPKLVPSMDMNVAEIFRKVCTHSSLASLKPFARA